MLSSFSSGSISNISYIGSWYNVQIILTLLKLIDGFICFFIRKLENRCSLEVVARLDLDNSVFKINLLVIEWANDRSEGFSFADHNNIDSTCFFGCNDHTSKIRYYTNFRNVWLSYVFFHVRKKGGTLRDTFIWILSKQYFSSKPLFYDLLYHGDAGRSAN